MQDLAPGWYTTAVWILNGTIFLTILTFVWKFSENRGKEIGLYMTLIPNFSYLIYSCIDILTEETDFNENRYQMQAIKVSLAHFSVYWSASFGLFTRFNAVAPRSAQFMVRYMTISLIICLTIAGSLAFIYLKKIWTHQQFIYSVYGNTLAAFCFALIIFVTAYIQKNSGNCHVALASMRKVNHLRIFWYSIIPIFCIGFDLLVDTYRYERSMGEFSIIGLVTSLIYRSWAIASLVKYWLVTQAHRARMSSVGNIDTSQMHDVMMRSSSYLSDREEA